MHTTGGYLTQVAYTHKYVFDLKPDTDVYWCTADVGWVTGHSYIVYGPLANRATSVLYEGTPDHPGKDRLWSIVEKYKVTIFYTAPTAIRTFMKWGDELPAAHDLSSLRLIGTVGEPINPEAWVWYYGVIGGERCPVVDTWWQTETGAIMISALPGATTLKPGSATFPLPGIEAGIVDDAGAAGRHPRRRLSRALTAVAVDAARHLGRPAALPRHVLVAFRRQVLRGRRRQARRRRVLLAPRSRRRHHAGRGPQHLDHRGGVRAGRPPVGRRGRGRRPQRRDDRAGDRRVRHAAQRHRARATTLVEELRDHVAQLIGPIAKPKTILFTEELPKTRSGKIMRRLLRNVAEDELLGDTTTLADPTVVDGIKSKYLASQPPEE